MSPDPQLGRTITHYRLLARLGEGGMGVVYLAEDLVLKRQVALKFLPISAMSDPGARARLVQEARAAAALLHPNVCPVYEIAEADGQSFIAMAHLEGRTLRQRLAEGPVPLAEALSIARQLAEGLAAAHARGIVHRDVKPANVMLLADGRAVLMDFGLARVGGTTRLTRSGSTLGTVAYMAPEQARGEEVDARSDVWALGVVLYELVAGKLPFGGESEAAQLYVILNAEPVPLTAAARDVPAGLNGIVTRALAKEPARRYAGAAELGADLGALERDLTAEPVGRGRRTRRQRAWLMVALSFGAVVLLVAATALNVGGLRERLFEGGPRIRSIAVLPLANLSGDPQQEYFADGMTEALINDLGQVSALRVISRTSAMAYKGAKRPLKRIALELGVDAIVEGSVTRAGDRVRISAQLIRVKQERQLWANTFERDLKDVLALQGEIAGTIAGAVKARLTPEEQRRLASARPINPRAHEFYLKGRYHLSKMTVDGIRRGFDYMRQAVEADPASALAHVGMADAYWWTATYGLMPAREAWPAERAAATKAMSLDDNLAGAHALLAVGLHQFEWDWDAAKREFGRAVALDPGSPDIRDAYSNYCMVVGRWDEGVDEARRALELDPVNPVRIHQLAFCLYYARRFDESIVRCKETLELNPGMAYTNLVLGWNYAQKRMYPEACAEARKTLAALPEDQVALAGGGFVLGLAGRHDEALRCLDRLRKLSGKTHVDPYNFAWVLDGLGDNDSTLVWLERSYRERSASMHMIRTETWTDGLRADPRFQDLVRRMKYPPEPKH